MAGADAASRNHDSGPLYQGRRELGGESSPATRGVSRSVLRVRAFLCLRPI